MCPRHIYTFDNESMDLELYKKIIKDCKDSVEFVWPYGIGEPMLHPNIFEMIRMTRDAGIRTGMSTNATMLDEKRIDMLLDCGLDYAIFAFDGASKETYEMYRTGATFEKTRQNILNFLEKKQQRKSPIYVVLQMVLLNLPDQGFDGPPSSWRRYMSATTPRGRRGPSIGLRLHGQSVSDFSARPRDRVPTSVRGQERFARRGTLSTRRGGGGLWCCP